MIRRDILLPDGVMRWLLVSQIEHARLSCQLAQHCLSHFGQAFAEDTDPSALQSVRDELLQAIRCHDDGWADWEAQPRFDPQLRRPLSFRELPLCEALANWEGSIRSAADVGPLAAWTVAGHFAALLEDSEKEHDEAQETRWLVQIAEQRTGWLADWQMLNPDVHTTQLAEEALQWLQAFDLLSLWLCCVCPAGGELVPHWPDGYRIGPGTSLDMRLHPVHAAAESPERIAVTVDLWRFDLPMLDIEATAHVVPAREYRDAADLLAAYTPHQLCWKLVP